MGVEAMAFLWHLSMVGTFASLDSARLGCADHRLGLLADAPGPVGWHISGYAFDLNDMLPARTEQEFSSRRAKPRG
jgi:hypothetical protein